MSEIPFNHCPSCGGILEHGYLIGKNHQIRWSGSAQGMTVFHGVPLMRLEEGFWRKWQSWSYAPSIAAARCPACRLAMFSYNHDGQEQPENERRASVFMGGFLLVVAMLLFAIAFWDWSPQPSLPLFFQFILVLIALLLIIMGVVFLLHVRRSQRADT
jgi:F0F1-type ATP synthase assembly protein I